MRSKNMRIPTGVISGAMDIDHRRSLAAVFVVASCLGCRDSQDGSSRDQGSRDHTRVDAPRSAPDVHKPDSCQPGCHWDCFGGGAVCQDGKLYRLGRGAAPCCRFEDPWPFPGPVCSSGTLYACLTKCAPVDSRYAHCFAPTPAADMPDSMAHLFKLSCAETQYAIPGTACQTDDQCRPMAMDVSSRLACDLASHQCNIISRPDRPPDFGASCGLTKADVPFGSETDFVTAGKNCAVCHVAKYLYTECPRQGCTMPCQYDEDCPEGTVCVCVSSGTKLTQICAAATDRAPPEGRGGG